MIKYCIEKWDKNKDILRSVLGNNKLLNTSELGVLILTYIGFRCFNFDYTFF